AMATDLAEFLGAALGLNLIFGIQLFVAGLITGVGAFGILALQSRGFRRLEAAIAGLVGVIVISFGVQVFVAKPAAHGVAHGLIPGLKGTESLLLAVGIIGATVMPHVIYLHSSLTQRRIVGATEEARRRILRFEFIDVMIAMGLAGIVNAAMLITAAAVFHPRGLLTVGDDLSETFDGLGTYLGHHADLLFGIGLLASGISSSSVGTLS